MNYLFVGTNPENTGASTHFVTLVQAMAEAGHEVSVVAFPGGPIAHELTQSSIHLYSAAFRNSLDLRGYIKVLAAARKSRPDWLVGNSGKEYWPLIFIGWMLDVPVTLFRHRAPPMKRLSAYFLPRLARRFLAVSNYARQSYLEHGIPADRVRVLYNPVNMARFRPDTLKRSTILRTLGIDDNAIVLGYCGRMHKSKGVFTLLEAATRAMAKEPMLHCLWLGDGPEVRALRDRAAVQPMASRHHFLGWIRDVHSYYCAMSMLAFPSIAPETFGRVSVEAQAAGVPVLGSDVGGVPETLNPGVTGTLLPPGDVDAWERGILKMCNPMQRLSMSTAARAYVEEHFSMAVIAAEFTRILAAS